MWTSGERRVYVTAQVVGAALLVLAFAGSFATHDLGGQILWIDIAVVALALSGAINVSWMLAGRRRIGDRRRALVDGIGTTLATPAHPRTGPESLVWLPGTVRIHEAGCPLVVGKPARAIDTATADASLRRCEVCR